MYVKKWEKLPPELQCEAVRPYYEKLRKKNFSLVLMRFFDILLSFTMLVIALPVFLILAVAIKVDSRGPVFYRQERVTQYGRKFRIFKFRSMCDGADRKGTLVTVDGDKRVTRVGKFIRKCRLDELCQLIDILRGTMTFVGTRPEVPFYVDAYTDEMKATLLLPAGVTSLASIMYKNEDELLSVAENADETYINTVLPAKMKWNLAELSKCGIFYHLKICFMTVLAVFGKEYGEKEPR